MSEFDDLLQEFDAPEKEDAPKESKPTILVIDDDESMRRGVSRALAHKYDVTTAETGQEGIGLFSRAFHCVILDVKMSDMSGFDTYPRLKAKCPEVPIVFFTAFQSEHDLQEVINKYKPEGYVQKGKDISFLENLIENAVVKYRLILENEEYKRDLEKKVEELDAAYKQLEEQHYREKRLERTITGGFAHEMRNALTGGTLELMGLVEFNKDQSAVEVLQDHTANILELLANIEERFNVPKEVINTEAIPLIQRMNEIMKNLENTINNVSQDMGRGLGITKQILNYSKMHEIQRGTDSVNISNLLNRLEDKHSAKCSELNISYKTNLPERDILISGDNIQIESIVQNFILNAIDALDKTDKKSIEVSLLDKKFENKTYVIVTVKDSGHGISKENVKHLFDPFFTKKYSTGTGLGLSVAKRMAELYDGKIEVKSEVGVGTKFDVYLQS